MRFFLDCEFIEDGRTIDLISVAFVAEDGREFYAELPDDEIPWHRASRWVLDNVRPHLRGGAYVKRRADMRDALVAFVAARSDDTTPEMWADYCAYDWVVVAQLFGTMMDLPTGWPMFCNDLQQLTAAHGNPKLPDQQGTEHDALADARWVRDAFAWLGG